jgi:transposase InsO family protein
VRRLMRQEGVVAATAKPRRYGSYLGEISPAPENLIDRDFGAAAPNEKWITVITEFQIPAGKVYLSPPIDCFDGLVASGTSACGRPPTSLIRCLMQPSRRWATARIGLWSTPMVLRTIVGQDGFGDA